MKNEELLGHIIVDPTVLVGKPVIRGTRVPVELILKKLSQNIDVAEVLRDFPRLTEDDIKAAILYAESVVEDSDIFPLVAAT